jgi:hypothetical protein
LEKIEQLGEHLAHAEARDDHVDQPVVLQELGGLETFR